MKHQILIASFNRDFVWLGPCLASLHKFSPDFLPPVVSVASEDFAGAREIADRHFPRAIITVKDGPPKKGNLRAQISMMSGDVLCPEADFVWLVGSDCILARSLDPAFFFSGDLPVMQMNSYDHLLNYAPGIGPWRDGVEAVLGLRPHYEFMRRLPLIYPHNLFPRVRAHISEAHKMPFETYVYNVPQDPRYRRSDASNFSESNIMGAFAFHYMFEAYAWEDLDNKPHNPENPLIQFWSHGGLDFVCDNAVQYAGGNTLGKTPRSIMLEVLGPNALR